MGANTAKLGQLRPVTFHLKTDRKGALQYGLIAEEVAKVYPELVIRGEQGSIDGVRYDELAPMLLNEVQQQQQKIATQVLSINTQAAEILELKQQQLRMQQQVAELKTLNQATQGRSTKAPGQR
jgi:trimeric autotransporter adhesin